MYPKNQVMRILFSILLAAIIALTGCSKVQTPDIVKVTFEKKYPEAVEISWNEDRNDMHEAHFRLEGEKYRADFLPDGTWIETEQSLEWEELPDKVQDVFKSKTKCNGDDIIEIEYVDHYEMGLFFDIEYKKKGKKKDISIR